MKAVIAESDLEDYPGMFLKFSENNLVEGVHAGYPLDVKMKPWSLSAGSCYTKS